MNDTHVNESILSEEILEDQKKNFRFWKKSPRQPRQRQENILETVFICSHRFILQTIVKTIVFIVDLTVTIRSTVRN